MGTEGNAFFGNFPHLSQAEYLKAAAVRQNGLFPVHKFMQSAGFFD